jgi:hypothetical protein
MHDLTEGGGPDRILDRFRHRACLIANGIGLAGRQPVASKRDLQMALAIR